MRDHHGRLTSSGIEHVFDQRVRRCGVEMFLGFVEDEDRETGQQDTSDPYALALTSRQRGAPLAEVRVKPYGKFVHPGAEPGPVDSRHQLVVGGVTPGEPEVLLQGGIEDVRVLGG